ncbi:hypothetical protein PVAP13_3NG228652 [Panicum virgatum]|uniref:Hexosyltransferase n=1 Tax=Panicum virgatum TaxID=38727 RepID=A0A8T0TXY5_PANVG|nr:hypothetical protein PVAP13_3NG228652 [Panicum virgatum]
MKGHQQQPHSSPLLLPPNKRRCTALAAAVPALVVCSILLPLVFLLGLHRPGYGSEERAAVVISTKLNGVGARNKQHLENGAAMKHKLLKDVSKKNSGSNGIPVEKSTRSKSKAKLKGAFSLVELNNNTFKSKGKHLERTNSKTLLVFLFEKDSTSIHLTVSSGVSGPHMPKRYQRKDLSWRSKDTVVNGKENHGEETVHEGNPTSCEHEYGSYCLWSTEHREIMKDAIVKRLKDQLFIARAHYPSIAKIKQHERFTRELKQSIQEHERMLSDTITDADLPPIFAKKLEKMEHTIERAKSCEVGCSNVERKLRQLLDMTEDEAYFHTRQSAILYHLGVQTMPKTHHCLNMRLTLEYFKSRSISTDQLNRQKLESPAFQHYVIFSRNVLAVSTTINSTVLNCQDSGSIVFHLFTDAQNFYAMKHWFERNSYLEATVHVTNIEDHPELPKHAEMQKLLPSEEFRVTIRNYSEPSLRQMKTDYISVFGHSHFVLPDLLPSLNRVFVLDDDLIVQKDLSSLWNLNMDGKVIGAVQFCGVKLGHLRAYISEHNFNSDACVWLSGLNVIELEKWRDLRVTSLYVQSLQKVSRIHHSP